MKKLLKIMVIVMLLVQSGFAISCYTTRPPKIAILYIATWRYFEFWPKFYESMEKHFLPQYEKHYYVFTDQNFKNKPDNVTKIYRKWHGFPDDSLDRYEMFLSIEDQLKKYDYIYFLNANAKVVAYVGEEIFPTKEQGIMVASHPQHYRLQVREWYPYEDNPKSTAYIAPDEGKYYVQGGFIGGRRKDFLKMCHVLDANIRTDKKNGVMAKFHDESHLNRYIIGKNPLIMPPNYIWQYCDPTLFEYYNAHHMIKIYIRSKYKNGGMEYFRTAVRTPLKEQLEKQRYYINQGDWVDYVSPVDREAQIFCRHQRVRDCGKLTFENNKIRIEWDSYPAEEFQLDKENEEFVLIKN